MLTRPRVLLIALFAALLGASLLAAPASARTYATTVVIKYPPAFYGELKSSKALCRYGRPVQLYKERPGPDELIYSDTTDGSGEWEMPIGDPALNPGSYYVQAAPTGHCRPGKSKTITF